MRLVATRPTPTGKSKMLCLIWAPLISGFPAAEARGRLAKRFVTGAPFVRRKCVQGQRVDPGVEFICQDGVYFTVAVNQHLVVKCVGHQDNLEMRLGPWRHVVFAAFVDHFHVPRVQSVLQLGFDRCFDGACFFHVLISGPAQEMRHHLRGRFFRRRVGFQSLQPESKFSKVFHVHRVTAT